MKLLPWLFATSIAVLALAAALMPISCADQLDIPVPGQSLPDQFKTREVSLPLITGDIVEVKYRWINETHIQIIRVAVATSRPQASFIAGNLSDGFYVIPCDVDLRKFDLDLFNVKYLIENKYHQESSLPVLLKISGKPKAVVQALKTSTLPTLKKVRLFKDLGMVSVKVPVEGLPLFFKKVASMKGVAKVYLDKKLHVNLDESVPLIGALQLWDLGYNGTGVKIAILDTGIDVDHPDFIWSNGTSKVVESVSFVPSEGPRDLCGHGTYCAGIAAGLGVPSMNISPGVAPGAKLVNVKVLCKEGWGYISWILAGMEWVVNNEKADIISMSFGSYTYGWDYDDPLIQAVNWAVENNVTVVCAAGNEGSDLMTVGSPGGAEKAITVGALYTEDSIHDFIIAGFSSRGPTPDGILKPDIIAPGVYITSSYPVDMGRKLTASGTSASTPHVAGVAAILKQMHPDWTPDMLKSAIVTRGNLDLGWWAFSQGGGRVNATASANASMLMVPAPISLGILTENYTSVVVAIINVADQQVQVDFDYSSSFLVRAGGSYYDLDITFNCSWPLMLNPGQSIKVNMTFNVTDATYLGYYYGYLFFSADGDEFHMPFCFIRYSKIVVSVENLPEGAASSGALLSLLADGYYQDAEILEGETAEFLAWPGTYVLVANAFNDSSTPILEYVIPIDVGSRLMDINVVVPFGECNVSILFNSSRSDLLVRQVELLTYIERDDWWYSWTYSCYYRVGEDFRSEVRILLGGNLSTDFWFRYQMFNSSEDIPTATEWWNALYYAYDIAENITFTFNSSDVVTVTHDILSPDANCTAYWLFGYYLDFEISYLEELAPPLTRNNYYLAIPSSDFTALSAVYGDLPPGHFDTAKYWRTIIETYPYYSQPSSNFTVEWATSPVEGSLALSGWFWFFVAYLLEYPYGFMYDYNCSMISRKYYYFYDTANYTWSASQSPTAYYGLGEHLLGYEPGDYYLCADIFTTAHGKGHVFLENSYKLTEDGSFTWVPMPCAVLWKPSEDGGYYIRISFQNLSSSNVGVVHVKRELQYSTDFGRTWVDVPLTYNEELSKRWIGDFYEAHLNFTGNEYVILRIYSSIAPDIYFTATYYDIFNVGGKPAIASITLNPGWNLISLPLVPDDPSVEGVFGDLDVYVFAWNSSAKGYEPVNILLPGKAYWVYAGIEEPATIVLHGTPLRTLRLDLSPGWNLIGGLYETAVASTLSGEIFEEFFYWNGTDYDTHTMLSPGVGYWVLAYQPSTVILESPPPQPPSPP